MRMLDREWHTAHQVRKLLLQGDAVLQVPVKLLASRDAQGAIDHLDEPRPVSVMLDRLCIPS